MRLGGRRLFVAVIGAAVLLAAGGWAVERHSRRFDARRAGDGGVIVALGQVPRGLQALDDALRTAEELAAVDPDARAARIDALRERADYQKDACRRWADRLARPAPPDGRPAAGVSAGPDASASASADGAVRLAELARLFAQAGELIDAALDASPTRPVAATQAAVAPVLAAAPDRTGVLPGARDLVNRRAEQVRKEADALARVAEREALAPYQEPAVTWGVPDRAWLAGLCTAAALLAALAAAVAVRRLGVRADDRVAAEIQRVGYADPKAGTALCYRQAGRMLDLAEEFTAPVTGASRDC